MHALSVSLLRAKQLPVITNGLGASPHAGSTCTIGVVTVRPLNRLPARLYFKLKPDPNNTFFFIFTCTTQYPWVLANLNLSQAMAPSKKKRIHTVFRDSSAHRSASTSKPRFVGEKVKLGELISKAKVERCGNRSFPVYSMTMHDGIVEQSGRFKKTIASKDTSSYKVVEKNQLVVGFPIDEGVIYVQNHDQPGIMSPAYNVWDFDSDRILPAYLEFALHSPQSMAYYAEKMRGTTARRRTLTGDALKNMSVPVPSIEDQYAVVKTLNCIKSQLAATHQMLDKLDHLVKSRFVEMFGNPKFEPDKWEVKPLGDVCATRLGKMLDAKKQTGECPYPYLANANVQWFRFELSNLRHMDFPDEDRIEFALNNGDVLVTEGGEVGRCAVWRGELKDCYFQKAVHRVRCDTDCLSPEYFVWCFKMKSDLGLFEPYISRSTIAHLTGKKIKQVPIPLPPLTLQQEFASFASQVDKSRFIAQQQIEKLQMLYDSLAQDYFGD